MFSLTSQPIDIQKLRAQVENPACGGFVSFEGRVRNRHNGVEVLRMEYEVYPKLALTEGNRILKQIKEEFGLGAIQCVHRYGPLQIGDIAVWVAAIAPHRGECFEAVAKAMSQIKHRLPIWKHEFYVDGTDAWVQCSHRQQELNRNENAATVIF